MAITYTPLATTTLGSNAASYTFSSISGSYTDLILVANAQTTTSQDALRAQFNSDTGTNYSYTQLYGNSGGASSNRGTSQTGVRISNGSPNSGSSFGISRTHFMNYSNATTYKSTVTRTDEASTITSAFVGLWRSTSAITSITIYPESGGNILTGSTFTLYGIKAA
jgi:hypothetical protein